MAFVEAVDVKEILMTHQLLLRWINVEVLPLKYAHQRIILDRIEVLQRSRFRRVAILPRLDGEVVHFLKDRVGRDQLPLTFHSERPDHGDGP